MARAGSRWGDLALEAVMVVFAVFVALALEEVREERQLQALADRAREAVETEIRANLEQMRSDKASVDAAVAGLAPMVSGAEPFDVETGIDLDLVDFSTGAWQAAQMSQGAGKLELDWVVEVSRAYDVIRITSEMQTDVIDVVADIIAGGRDLETFSRLFGRLVVLTQTYETLQEQLEGLVGGSGGP